VTAGEDRVRAELRQASAEALVAALRALPLDWRQQHADLITFTGDYQDQERRLRAALVDAELPEDAANAYTSLGIANDPQANLWDIVRRTAAYKGRHG